MINATYATRTAPLTISHKCATRMLARDDWALICDFMAPTGKYKRGILSDNEYRVLAGFGDGFGSSIKDETILFDWSHIRDSSDEAVTTLAKALRLWISSKTA